MPGPDPSQLLLNGPATAPTTVILAHGAGVGMDTPFMEFFAQRLAEGDWLEDGEHSFKPRKASGRTESQNWHEAVAALITFVASEPHGPGFRSGRS
jgi:predicted alpha/beta-hydrolase family hydrolase